MSEPMIPRNDPLRRLITADDLTTQVTTLKSLTLADLEAFAATHTSEELCDLIRSLDHEIQMLTRMSTYLAARGGYGYDAGHKAAVKAQNSAVAKVRKALGFSVARLDLTF